mgnify:CR=1 FL=1
MFWLIWFFSKHRERPIRPTVRPPRLGGNERLGVFATRSPFRPNGLGVSLVNPDKVCTAKGVTLHLSGRDLLDGTPVVDIKPYVPWIDYQPQASGGWAKPNEPLLEVSFSPQALEFLTGLEKHQQTTANSDYPANELEQLISQVLAQNPKPAYQKPDPTRIYATQLAGLEIKFCYLNDEQLEVSEIFLAG